MSLNNEFNVSVFSLAWGVMALKLSSVTDHGIGYIVLCLSAFVIGLNKIQLFALCSMVENFALTPFLYFLLFQKPL